MLPSPTLTFIQSADQWTGQRPRGYRLINQSQFPFDQQGRPMDPQRHSEAARFIYSFGDPRSGALVRGPSFGDPRSGTLVRGPSFGGPRSGTLVRGNSFGDPRSETLVRRPSFTPAADFNCDNSVIAVID
ncbi:hypothetical protein F2P81_009656 [Scophthalmus maximus]|uniref:Uncharacterized protein n=1 Tax=Scophthalmus maximus TaxID=52904 RepID=A0A6A4TAI7_SCOMX|nr:hypothetical protein F2P81_009656 [Scophthalmus maximus]